jgi:deoxycytidylate deaminase
MTRAILVARKVAMNGDRRHHNHAAAIIVNGQIMCVKGNMANRNMSKVLNQLIWPKKNICLNHHAEMHVIHSYATFYYRKVGKENIRAFLCKQKITLFVARFNKKGDMKLSMPCGMCCRLMIAIGVKKVIYSGNRGELIKIKPKHLPNNYESTGTRHILKIEKEKETSISNK